MNMKVHQTLVWLNLLSFRTKDLAEPTIGIQSAAANHSTLARHFDTNVPAVPAVTAILVCLCVVCVLLPCLHDVIPRSCIAY
jgi:hypothetical protein